MRTSTIAGSAKNNRTSSGRRRLATLAATAVLVSGVQFLATDTAWACGPSDAEAQAVTAPAKPSTADEQNGSVELHGQGATSVFSKAPTAITVGGAKTEFSIRVTNNTGADYHRIIPSISLYNLNGNTPRPPKVTAEVLVNGHWQRFAMQDGCDPAIHGTAQAAGVPLAKGHSTSFRFRLGLSADVPQDVHELQLFARAGSTEGAKAEIAVVRPAASPKPTTPAKPKPTTPAKPAPKPTEDAEPAPAKPAADKTTAPAPAAEAPKASTPTAAPATTAPAGTPELAHTGSSSRNSFLALGSAALLALGAGVLIAVRRLRPQR
ncbi:LAETG motif-containing sortase-dependent surface protein [Kitasatospora sp. NPDC056651]|uniref:LAETG motif-containing sortase-dependent surface protein n=1 Tax=Kitasatospora sp. NPDC056651 TaxID=3345892 RepID=UPI00367F3A2D